MSQLVSTPSLIESSLSRVKNTLRDRRRQKEYTRWLRAGKPTPPPHLAKQAVLKEYAERFQTSVLIETGTFLGDMVEAMRNSFDTIYSIELSPRYFERAQQRFAGCSHIQLLQGDSGNVLGEILPKIGKPCLLWLDGHYSAGNTARGEKDTPVLEELIHVIESLQKQPGHIVLIDDARCFGSDPNYPSVAMIEDFLAARLARFELEVADDIIRITSLAPNSNVAAN